MISAIIPTFKGAERLDRNLASVVASLSRTQEPWEILIVDDGGGGVTASTPGVCVIERATNRGYGPAVNDGVRQAKGEYLLILNDDVRLELDTVARLRRHFTRPDLFAVVPSILSPLSACGDEAGKGASWSAGLVEIRELRQETVLPTFYAVGCCFLCPSLAWRALGGYDEIFAPFFWEDVDLAYRASRAGLHLVHDPAAVCHHEGSATLAEHRSLPERERVEFRNRILFHLRNVQAPARRAEMLGALAAYALFEARSPRIAGLLEALAIHRSTPPRLPIAGLTDDEILRRVSAP